MSETTVELGGKEYKLRPLPIRQARKFREQLKSVLGNLATALESAPEIKLNDAETLNQLMGLIKEVVLSAPDLVWEIVCEYSPEIAANSEELENSAVDEEIIAAFVEVVKQLYPFGGIYHLIGQLKPQT